MSASEPESLTAPHLIPIFALRAATTPVSAQPRHLARTSHLLIIEPLPSYGTVGPLHSDRPRHFYRAA